MTPKHLLKETWLMGDCNLEQNKKQHFAHETAVIDLPCEIGSGTKIWHFSHVMKNARLVKIVILGKM